jgi:hypothetical protein
MKTSEFLKILRDHPSKSLIFEYGSGNKVGDNYHITEVKNTSIESVDCGGQTDAWRETVVQLWENPAEKDKPNSMSAYKAKAILDRVHSLRPMVPDATIRFEYGNASFHTAQLYVQGIIPEDGSLTVVLASSPTLCKAEDLCGIPAEPESVGVGCCDPGSGCC